MFRGILIWMAFCLGLVVMWQLARFAAQRDQLLEDHYALQGQSILDQPIEALQEAIPHRSAVRSRCLFSRLEGCEHPGCEPARISYYSRLQ
jgi:hypothetical protein